MPMIFYTDENPFKLLENNGYHLLGLGKWEYVKHFRTGRFHAFIDYNYNDLINIHWDKVNKKGDFSIGHRTIHKDDNILNEIRAIKNSTFNGKLDLLRDKI